MLTHYIPRETTSFFGDRYAEKGIFGLLDYKRGPKTPHNKTSGDVASKVVETADRHPELDAPEIIEALTVHLNTNHQLPLCSGSYD